MPYTHTCTLCGKTFVSNRSNSRICNSEHFFQCVICGKQFEVHSVNHAKTCSEKCRRAAISKTEQAKSPTYKCRCKECGSEFLSKSPFATVCDNDHFKICKVCGKSFKVTKQQILSGTQTCSEECRYQLSGDSFSKSYGIQASDEAHEDYRKKYEASLLKSYGVTNPMKSDIVKQKSNQTSLERYGDTSFTRTELYIKKATKTNRERYGTDWHAQTAEHRQSVIATCKRRYGADNVSRTFEEISKRMHDVSKALNWNEFRKDPDTYIQTHKIENPTLNTLEVELGVRASSVSEYLRRYKDISVVSLAYSNMEDEVHQFLLDIGVTETDIIRNTKNEISPYELDIYIPKYRFAIECNPTATHNSSKEDPWGNDPKSWKYHQMKTDSCDKTNIQLFHIFGYEWTHKRSIIESMIANCICATQDTVWARNTYVTEISSNECKQFLNRNHRQGNIFASIRLGLRDNKSNELVSVMTFNKVRSTIGKTDKFEGYELSRFCSKLHTSVVGGASKLFKNFLINHPDVNVVSFSDKAHTSGKLYQVLGFHKVNESTPSYVWVNMEDDTYYNRVNCQKKNLRRLFHDESLDIETKTERQIMEEHGYARVFDSGTIRWEYTNTNKSL